MTILAVCGLLREARIAAGPGVAALAGDAATLRKKLEAAVAPDTRGIVSFGIAGGLANSLKPGDCVIASEIVANGQRFATDEAWRARMIACIPDAIAAPVAGLDAIVTTKAAKADLQRATGAHAADMESHIAAAFARARDLPFAALRTISDPWDAELPPLAVQQIKEVILAGEDGSLEEGLRLEAKAIQLMFSSQDQKEGMAAFIEKRKPTFQGK